MKNYITVSILAFGLCLASTARAGSALKDPKDIEVPIGYELVEVPAVFVDKRVPIPTEDIGPITTSPAVYKAEMRDGRRVRVKVLAEKSVSGIMLGPNKHRLVRTIEKPVSYDLKNSEGHVVQSWQWQNGELVATK